MDNKQQNHQEIRRSPLSLLVQEDQTASSQEVEASISRVRSYGLRACGRRGLGPEVGERQLRL